jgi:hypothetical protein
MALSAMTTIQHHFLSCREALPSVCIINKIRKTMHRAPSGIAMAPVILAALAWQVSKQSEIICYWAIGIIVFDPMNWVILAVGLREALGRVRKGL